MNSILFRCCCCYFLLLSFVNAQQDDTIEYRNWRLGSENTKDKLALVIGNSNYLFNGTLTEPSNDAKVLANALHQQGADILEAYDLKLEDMEKIVLEFARSLKTYKEGIIFYAGHGFQVDGVNYLVPIDANPQDKTDVALECVDLESILKRINDGRKPKIIILDACRNNPFVANWQNISHRGMLQGFTEVASRSNIKFVFSTATNTRVADDNPFAEELAKEITKGGCFDDIFRAVLNSMDELNRLNDTYQEPWSGGNLRDQVCFGIKEVISSRSAQKSDFSNSPIFEPDTDGDGVPDSRDDCINSKGLMSNGGCPITELESWLERIEQFSAGDDFFQREAARLKGIKTPATLGRLGFLYLKGELGENEKNLGVELVRQAAGAGDAFSAYQLGLLYGEGKYVKKESENCRIWFERAAIQNNATLQWQIANHYAEGKLFPAELNRAFHWIVISARSGNLNAQNDLGTWYANGIGTDIDKSSSVAWYLRAAKSGFSEAQFNLGMCYLKGEGVATNVQEGLRWLKEAASQNHERAINELSGR